MNVTSTAALKDVLYLHDTIETFGGALPAIREEWETNVRPGLHMNAIRQVEKAADVLFAEVDDTIREAARIAVGRNLTAESIREACSYGWNQIFPSHSRGQIIHILKDHSKEKVEIKKDLPIVIAEGTSILRISRVRVDFECIEMIGQVHNCCRQPNGSESRF